MQPSRGFRTLSMISSQVNATTTYQASASAGKQIHTLAQRTRKPSKIRNQSIIGTRSARSNSPLPISTSPKTIKAGQRIVTLLSCRHASTSATPASETSLKHTPLYQAHVDAGAKFGPFAGFSMPLEYPDQSHPESHKWTRANASLFDVSHMVQHKLSGPLAEQFLMTVTPSSINTLGKHQSTLSCLLNDDGGIVDDTVITRLGRDSFYFVTNAGCRETDIPYLERAMRNFLTNQNASQESITWHILEHHALLALQGPRAVEVLAPMIYQDPEETDTVDTDLTTLGFGQSRWFQLTLPDGMNTPSLLVSRTGYTGEDGFEISIPPENGDSSELATSIANAFLQSKGDASSEESSTPVVRWAGLAARDSLRLEAGMCLYGHDISTETTPPMAALGWIVGKDRRDPDASKHVEFKGQSTILEQLSNPKTMSLRRVGFVVEKGPAAREGAEIIDPTSSGDKEEGEVIGKITSGCPSPTLGGQNIAMGLVKNGYHKKGTPVVIRVRKGVRKAEVAKLPFVESKFYRPDLKGKGKKEAEKDMAV